MALIAIGVKRLIQACTEGMWVLWHYHARMPCRGPWHDETEVPCDVCGWVCAPRLFKVMDINGLVPVFAGSVGKLGYEQL